VISNTRHALDVISVLSIIRWTTGATDNVDVVPLFETIDDLAHAGKVMEELYQNETYIHHLTSRDRLQTIMLGFSDGTKDGGYLRANWSIFRAKEELTAISRKHGIRVLFFDGRGGPPSRGGGNTHKFYSSQGPTIESQEVQLTIQGQTVSSNFGSHDAAVYNIEQLFSAGIENAVFVDRDVIKGKHPSLLNEEQRDLLDKMANESYRSYAQLKQRPEFLTYLQEVGTLEYYGGTNIGSRPVKRGQKTALTLDSLRAIPFTGSWSQMKQNVPGFYGFGTAIQAMQSQQKFEDVRSLYRDSRFFQTLVGNSMQSLSKSFFPLTAYLKDDPEFGDFWKLLHKEYELTVNQLLEISDQEKLMDDAPVIRQSIRIREQIVLPLLTIQQAALQKIRSGLLTEEQEALWRKVVLRTMYGIINAGRNVA
jgi:phosphoenolpyruvate carboxylase